MAFRCSCLVHGLLLLLLSGSLTYRPAVSPAAPDPEIAAARHFAEAVADKMPLWDADELSRYEGAEIGAVKADILTTLQEEESGPLLEDAVRLHAHWDALVALDAMLKQESLI